MPSRLKRVHILVGHGAGLALPYRGQAAIVMPTAAELTEAPEGPCREVLLRSRMTRSVFTTSGPLLHAGLGLPAYVQFTSPIRRLYRPARALADQGAYAALLRMRSYESWCG